MPPISFFALAQLSQLTRHSHGVIGENCFCFFFSVRPAPTDIFIEGSILIPIPIPTPSRAPKKNLALLSAFEFKVTCSSFSPVSSRFESLFIFVFPLSQFRRTLASSVYRVSHNLVPRALFLGFGGVTGKASPSWSIHS